MPAQRATQQRLKKLPKRTTNDTNHTNRERKIVKMAEIILAEESYQIIGACFEVYNEMGSGFLESVYQECLEIEFQDRGIPFVPQLPLELRFKGRLLKRKYEPDFICFGKIIVEIKAVKELSSEFRAQVYNYLRATGHRLGLLVNLGQYPKLEYERIVR
jgi:GxxExxY protein